MGQDETPKKKLKRDHPQKDHVKAKSASESKPKKKSDPKKAKKTEEKSPPKKEKKKVKKEPEEVKKETTKEKKKEKHSLKSEETVELMTKPGQKHPEPSLEDPTRAFYESLYEQNPASHMAQKYCLEYGLLPEDTAARVAESFKKKAK